MPALTFPTIITATDVEDAVFATLKPRMDWYMPQRSYPKIRTWLRETRMIKWPEDATPVLIVSCPGLAQEPTKRSKEIDAPWTVGVAVICSARTRDETDKAAKLYGAVARAVLLQEPSLHGFARGVDWLDEDYNDLPAEQDRTLAIASLTFMVDVENVVDARELPFMPDGPLPTPSDFVVTEAVLNVENTQEVNP